MRDAGVLIVLSALTIMMTIGLGLQAGAAIPGIAGIVAGTWMVRGARPATRRARVIGAKRALA